LGCCARATSRGYPRKTPCGFGRKAEAGLRKPQPEIFHLAIKGLGVAPEECTRFRSTGIAEVSPKRSGV
jgi:hypothetical protein